MILESIKRNHVADDKLWEMVNRANHLTLGDYDSWDNNAPALVPLLERILVLSREREEWQIYFYVMAKLFWYIRRSTVNNISLSFKLSEMFHRDFEQRVGENVSSFASEWRVDLAAKILSFYCEYPQIDDAKIARMLEIFRECEARYGGDWNYGSYTAVMNLALFNRDKKLAEEAAGKLKKTMYANQCYCYVCTYARPMIGYHVLRGETEDAAEIVSRVCKKTIPSKYRWCFDMCQQANEEDMKDITLMHCLDLRAHEQFARFFENWQALYRQPKQGEVDDTFNVFFHALAGDWSRKEERLLLAEQDDQGRREQKETPLDSLYWLLCWYGYFRMLDERGEGNVNLALGEQAKDGRRAWSCRKAAEYFVHQADLLGEQMNKSRARFDYEGMKACYEECLKYRKTRD